MSDAAIATVQVEELPAKSVDEIGTTIADFGTTIADARRFAKRADHIFIHYATAGAGVGTRCFMLSRGVFLKAIKTNADTDPMMVRLYQTKFSRELFLQVG
jgi:purine-cytosine permease-like protein